jgi:hypothetical protein
MSTVIPIILSLGFLSFQESPVKPVADNDRVLVQEMKWGSPSTTPLRYDTDALIVYLDGAGHKPGDIKFEPKGTSITEPSGTRAMVIRLKDHTVAPLENKTGFQNAFPRPGSKKLFENPRIVVWDYSWTPGKPSPMHFHDKDVVVVYLADGSLKSTTPDHKDTVNEISFGLTKFNPRDRTHTEEVVKGNARAVMMELK